MKLPCLELSFTGPRGFYASAYVQGLRYATTQNKTQVTAQARERVRGVHCQYF